MWMFTAAFWREARTFQPQGAVEKIHQRRSRQFSVLTYCQYAPRGKLAVALLDGLF